jgi:energy-converting hydrogenase Eha subunit A
MFVSPKIMALTGFFGNIILGVILGAILSFFIKKEKPAFSE